jgi:ABC-type polar amino acid transport system ATPase subunit
MLIGNNITKVYGTKAALTDVNASISPGEITALIGPSGSGKSTFLRALSLLDPPDKGKITVDDEIFVFPKKNGNMTTPPLAGQDFQPVTSEVAGSSPVGSANIYSSLALLDKIAGRHCVSKCATSDFVCNHLHSLLLELRA